MFALDIPIHKSFELTYVGQRPNRAERLQKDLPDSQSFPLALMGDSSKLHIIKLTYLIH